MMFPSVLYILPPHLRRRIALFAVAEGWLLFDIGWCVLFYNCFRLADQGNSRPSTVFLSCRGGGGFLAGGQPGRRCWLHPDTWSHPWSPGYMNVDMSSCSDTYSIVGQSVSSLYSTFWSCPFSLMCGAGSVAQFICLILILACPH